MEGENVEQKEIQPEEVKASAEFSGKPVRKGLIRKQVIVISGILIILAFFVLAKGFGLRFDFFVQKVSYQKYDHLGPDFSYQYPNYYETDNNDNNKFGADYISGFRLSTDQRTGCDIRSSAAGINFKKSDAEIKSALEQELSKSAKGFRLLNASRIKIGGEPAFQVEFSFTDPLGGTVRLSQNLVTHDGQSFLLICGTGDYQYKFFQKDFEHFLQSFEWKAR